MFLVPLIHQMGTFFSAAAWHQAQNTLKSAEDLGIPLHYNMGVDKAGLHCYCTVWGANYVEGNIHMPL